jgi:hypothetical protein
MNKLYPSEQHIVKGGLDNFRCQLPALSCLAVAEALLSVNLDLNHHHVYFSYCKLKNFETGEYNK